MKQTITVRDNHSRKLRDSISSELKGEVEIQVKNKKTGEVEKIEKHNMIVYGGREWLLRRAFGPMLSDNDNDTHILNSAIKWVGFGSGGGEPANPLQSGCTLGQDKDLYNPIRIRYPNDNNKSQLNQFYSSRILSDGTTVSGYYKQISYISLKDDAANPYVENGIIEYPKTIAEIRIELSSDDCNGSNYTNLQNNVAYQDINEAALFISDANIDDPALSGQLSTIDIIPTGMNRTNYPVGINVEDPDDADQNLLMWYDYTKSNSQYYDFYKKIESEQPTDYSESTSSGIKYYTLEKLNTIPVFIGTKDSSDDKICVVHVTLSEDKHTILVEDFFNGGRINENVSSGEVVADIVESFEFEQELTNGLDDVVIKSHGTVHISYDRKIELKDSTGRYYPVFDSVQFRNTFNQSWTTICKPNSFVEYDSSTQSYISNSVKSARQWLPIGFIQDNDGNWVKINPDDISSNVFVLGSNIKVNETVNTVTKISINAIETDESSYQIKCYVSKEDIKKVSEGMKIYTDHDTSLANNTIPSSSPLLVTSVYDPYDNAQVIANLHEPYFTVDRPSSITYDYPADEPLSAYVYSDKDIQCYRMFSRVTFSSIRKTIDREIILMWKLYF